MNYGTISTDTGSIDYGPSTFQAVIGNPSPANPGQLQIVQSTGYTFLDSIRDATKAAVSAAIGPGPSSTAAIAKGAEALGEGAKAAGAGFKSVATSASSGIKWGLAAIVVLVVLFVAAPYVGLIPRR